MLVHASLNVMYLVTLQSVLKMSVLVVHLHVKPVKTHLITVLNVSAASIFIKINVLINAQKLMNINMSLWMEFVQLMEQYVNLAITVMRLL
jgi:hypothetical protein